MSKASPKGSEVVNEHQMTPAKTIPVSPKKSPGSSPQDKQSFVLQHFWQERVARENIMQLQ